MMRSPLNSCLFVFILVVSQSQLCAGIIVFSNDFDGNEAFYSGVAGGFSGVTTRESVQGYSGIGTGSNVFSGDMLRNDTGSLGVPASRTMLTITGLPSHDQVDISFLLATIDSWDGSTFPPTGSAAPDFFNVLVDGETVLSETFEHVVPADASYTPPPGVKLAVGQLYEAGGRQFHDAAYDMGLDPIFSDIAHTSNTITLEWFASGTGWQGGLDESFAIDNVQIRVSQTSNVNVVPEPSSLVVFATGMFFVGLARVLPRRKRGRSTGQYCHDVGVVSWSK